MKKYSNVASEQTVHFLRNEITVFPFKKHNLTVHFRTKDYDSTLKLIRNIIIVDIQDIYTKASFKYAKDVYANPQMILTIQATFVHKIFFGKRILVSIGIRVHHKVTVGTTRVGRSPEEKSQIPLGGEVSKEAEQTNK